MYNYIVTILYKLEFVRQYFFEDLYFSVLKIFLIFLFENVYFFPEFFIDFLTFYVRVLKKFLQKKLYKNLEFVRKLSFLREHLFLYNF